jgi:hypothetical protein
MYRFIGAPPLSAHLVILVTAHFLSAASVGRRFFKSR